MGKEKKILVANPGLDVVACGQEVTAWALQAEAGRFLLVMFCRSFLQSVALCLADQTMRPATAAFAAAENATIKSDRY